jgi:hypothetical protein
MMEDATNRFLLRLLEENWQHAKLSEEKRALVAHLVLVITFTSQVVIVFTGFSKRALPVTCFLILLGVYALAVSRKLYERAQFHTLRARKLRTRLDQMYSEAKVEALQSSAEVEHAERYSFWMHVRLNNIWLGLHILVVILGIAETIVCLSN